MHRNKHLILSSFILKLIAMTAVLSDHIAYLLVPQTSAAYTLMRIIGRIAFILFAFFVTEGVVRSRNKDKYLLRLLALYVVIQIGILVVDFVDPFYEFQNIFATLLPSAAALVYLEKKEWKKVYYLLPFVVVTTINILFEYGSMYGLALWAGDYGLYGTTIILGFYFARKLAIKYLKVFPIYVEEESSDCAYELEKQTQVIYNAFAAISLLIITFIWYILSVFSIAEYTVISFQTYALLAIPLLLLYSGKLGHNGKTFRIIYYLFFPVHLLILALLSLIL